ADASPVACPCGELCAEPLELALGPLGFERLLPRVVPVDDRLPGRRALLESALALEQERAAVQRADVVRIELQRATPIAESPLRVTAARFRLAPRRDQHGVVGGQGESGLGDLHGAGVVVRGEVGVAEEPILA